MDSSWPQGLLKNLRVACSTKQDGNMSFRWGEREGVISNRKRFLERNGIAPDDTVVMSLTHRTTIKTVGEKEKGAGVLEPGGVEADCLITKEKGLFLFLLTADCLPTISFEPQQEVLALAHLSRHNTKDNFIQKIVNHLIKAHHCRATQLMAIIGPAIHQESYDIDLIGLNQQQLIRAGVLSEKIEVSDVDTAQSKNFFSHRRSKRTGEPEGRFATVVGML